MADKLTDKLTETLISPSKADRELTENYSNLDAGLDTGYFVTPCAYFPISLTPASVLASFLFFLYWFIFFLSVRVFQRHSFTRTILKTAGSPALALLWL